MQRGFPRVSAAQAAEPAAVTPANPAIPANTGVAASVELLALGDSLTSGYGLAAGQGFVPQLQAALDAEGESAHVVNAGVSGDTSAGGLARLDWLLSSPVPAGSHRAVLLELGANDGLRGTAPAELEHNLSAILDKLAAQKVPVLLAGMYAPPNLGADYGRAFNAIYPRLAQRPGVLFYPFFLEGVAADPALNQADGMHPNPAGVAIIVRGILPAVRQLLAKAAAA